MKNLITPFKNGKRDKRRFLQTEYKMTGMHMESAHHHLFSGKCNLNFDILFYTSNNNNNNNIKLRIINVGRV